MYRLFVSIFLSVLISTVSFAAIINAQTNNPFPDTSPGKVSGQAAADLFQRGIINGFPDGEFKGDLPVNRAEAAKFLLLSSNRPISDVKNNGRFPDVIDNEWYEKYIITAANLEIIDGHPDGTFRPSDGINAAEFLKMFTKAFALPENLPHNYQDVDSSHWYSKYAGIAEKYEMFPNRDHGKLYADTPLSRYEVATAIHRYFRSTEEGGGGVQNDVVSDGAGGVHEDVITDGGGGVHEDVITDGGGGVHKDQ